MDRRRVLLVIAVLIAALGSALVILYTKGADTRAEEKFDTVEVLRAVAVIDSGEKIEDAQAAGKLALEPVTQDSLLDGYQTSIEGLAGTVALSPIYPGEQIISSKFGASAAAPSALQIPDGAMAATINLTDTARVAGFVNPGSEVAIFWTGPDPDTGQSFTRLLLDRITVLGVGSTTPVATTTTDEAGVAVTEQLPRTLITLSLDQLQVQRVTLAATTGELSFSLLTDKSTVQDAPGTFVTDLFQ